MLLDRPLTFYSFRIAHSFHENLHQINCANEIAFLLFSFLYVEVFDVSFVVVGARLYPTAKESCFKNKS